MMCYSDKPAAPTAIIVLTPWFMTLTGTLLFPLKDGDDKKLFLTFPINLSKGRNYSIHRKRPWNIPAFRRLNILDSITVAVDRRDFLAPIYHSFVLDIFYFYFTFAVCLVFATAIS